jgi:hypothetical protein
MSGWNPVNQLPSRAFQRPPILASRVVGKNEALKLRPVKILKMYRLYIAGTLRHVFPQPGLRGASIEVAAISHILCEHSLSATSESGHGIQFEGQIFLFPAGLSVQVLDRERCALNSNGGTSTLSEYRHSLYNR